MPNRKCRDDLIMTALRSSHAEQLIDHDMPNGVVTFDAYSIDWMQDILDFWYHMFPFGCTVSTEVQLTSLSVGNNYFNMPDDFILDVKHGLIIQTTDQVNSKARVYRVTLQELISIELSNQSATHKRPAVYTVLANRSTGQQIMRVAPKCDRVVPAWLWYYSLPLPLNSEDVPLFPSDYVIVEYLKLRAKEWIGVLQPGTAQKFCDGIVKTMQANGLLNEPEADNVEFDRLQHLHRNDRNAFSWMGPQ